MNGGATFGVVSGEGGLEGKVQGEGNPMLEEWDCRGGEKMEGRKEGSGGETDSGRICVALWENRGGQQGWPRKG